MLSRVSHFVRPMGTRAAGTAISLDSKGNLIVPNDPILPFIEGALRGAARSGPPPAHAVESLPPVGPSFLRCWRRPLVRSGARVRAAPPSPRSALVYYLGMVWSGGGAHVVGGPNTVGFVSEASFWVGALASVGLARSRVCGVVCWLQVMAPAPTSGVPLCA
jgi:hypothetical protein